jgi:NTP pyrophosphatase (non-canonical NTP hydrolase)
MSLISVCNDIATERERQDNKWGVQDHDPAVWLSILAEETGEVARAVLGFHFPHGGDNPVGNYRDELVQVAAVAVAAIESVDRRSKAAPRVTHRRSKAAPKASAGKPILGRRTLGIMLDDGPVGYGLTDIPPTKVHVAMPPVKPPKK